MNQTGSQPAAAGSINGLKVMVIDDSNTIRRSAEIFLGQAGCQVILAEDGFDALAKVADHEIPVIMLSSKDGLFDRARGRMVGSDQYLTKPFTKDSLLKAVVQFSRRVAIAQ
jgi:twitching motility two-component system response regulator PilG